MLIMKLIPTKPVGPPTEDPIKESVPIDTNRKPYSATEALYSAFKDYDVCEATTTAMD